MDPVKQQDSATLSFLSPENHCYKCPKQKIIASKHEKQNPTSRNIGQYVY